MSTLTQRYHAPTNNPDNSAEKQEQYCKSLEGMTDDKLYDACKDKIWLSTYANNNPRSCFHWQCDACYDECNRRGQPDIYNRAHKSVVEENS